MRRTLWYIIVTVLSLSAPCRGQDTAHFMMRRSITHAEDFFRNRETGAQEQIKTKLAALRQQKIAKKWSFDPVYTSAMDHDLKRITGARIPANFKQHVKDQNVKAALLLAKRKIKRPLISSACFAGVRSYDWRQHHGVTPVKDQGDCGTCWDFAAHGAMEGSWEINSDESINSSEQNTLDCNSANDDCSGGWPSDAFDYLQNSGSATAASYPYTAARGKCLVPPTLQPFKVYAWGYVGDDDEVPPVDKIKEALCYYGPLAVCVYATDAFQSYGTGQVFNENASGDVNHCVTLIGWDDDRHAWLIKNSWGTGWGDPCGFGTERGYMWIDYGSNNIGYGAAWVVVQQGIHTNPSPTIDSWTINQPIVNQKGPIIYDGVHASPRIMFRPGDTVEITAGGCVQTGGSGNTWKRYVNPSGPNSDRLYFGMIQIPGLTSGLVAIRSTRGAYYTHQPDEYTVRFPGVIPAGLPSDQQFLELGYMDDGYGDNGYWGHDDGTEDQCKHCGDAYLTIRIIHP